MMIGLAIGKWSRFALRSSEALGEEEMLALHGVLTRAAAFLAWSRSIGAPGLFIGYHEKHSYERNAPTSLLLELRYKIHFTISSGH